MSFKDFMISCARCTLGAAVGGASGVAAGAAGAAVLGSAGHAGYIVNEAIQSTGIGNAVLGFIGANAVAKRINAYRLFDSAKNDSAKKPKAVKMAVEYTAFHIIGSLAGYGIVEGLGYLNAQNLINFAASTMSLGKVIASVSTGGAIIGIPLTIGLGCCLYLASCNQRRLEAGLTEYTVQNHGDNDDVDTAYVAVNMSPMGLA